MRFVYVLEDDTKFQKEICEAISFIDPKIQIRIFPKLESFVDWVRLMMTTGPAAISAGGTTPTDIPQDPVIEEPHQLVAVISKIEFLGAKQLGLLRKTRDLFVQRQICTKEDPTAFVLTAFDDPQFKIRDLEDRILSNVLFKPFDRLILVQHLTFAIDGRHPPSKYTIANQKTTAVVEMLKDIEIEGISEVGIVTKSNREISLGAVAKYYGSQFVTARQRSVIAVCHECKPHPDHPQEFRCAFSFLALDPGQISSIRKLVRDKQAKAFDYDFRNMRRDISPDRVQVVMLDEEEEGPAGIKGMLEKRFESVKVLAYENYGSLHSDLDPAEAVKGRDANIKAFGSATWVSMQFDLAGLTYLGFEADQKDLMALCGLKEPDLKKTQNWFVKGLSPDQKEKFRHYVKTTTLDPKDNVFVVSVENISYYVKVLEAKKEDKKFTLKVTELSKDEQINWLTQNSRIKDPVDLLIVSHRFFNETAKERWTNVMEALKKRFGKAPLLFMTSKKDFSDREEREFGSYVTDIFFKPIDRSYLEHKIKWAFPRLNEKGDRIQIPGVVQKGVIKTANPVTVSEISEAGFVMTYYRNISVGSFREIVLWQPYEIGAPELLATCNFVEETGKDAFSCHFVFFGASDHFLKHIRVWIRDNYIHAKEGSG